MRKFRIGLILAAMAVAAFLPFANPAPAAADDTPTIGTEMFLPTSYLQYYKLENPYAICRYSDAGGDVVAISHQGKIVVYKNETFLAMDISDLNNTVGVPNLFIYRNFLLFSASNKLFYVDISDGSAFTRKTLDGVTCSCFAIFGDSLCVATNSDINFYDFYYSASDLSVTELPSKKIERNNVTNIHLSKDGYVYYSDQNTDIYRKDPEDASSPEERLNAAETIEGIKCICENPDPSDDNLYYSCTNGIFSFSKATGTASEIVRSSVKTADADISSVYEPQGICIVEGKLWIVDKYIKAVQEIDLTDNEFTEFAITTNSRAVNRLNDAIDITIDGDKIYALDENKSIVVINNVGGIRTYNRIALPEAATAFSAGGGYVAYTTGSDFLKIGKIESTDDENILSLSGITTIPLDNVAADTFYSENAFYVLSTVREQANQACVYKIPLSDGIGTIENVMKTAIDENKTCQMAVDIFGAVYYAIKTQTEYEYYVFDGGENSFLTSAPLSLGELKNIQTDLDGKIYALYDDNMVECYRGNEKVFSKELKINRVNLGNIDPAKSMCLSCDSEKAYFIFEGLILTNDAPEEMDVTTARKMVVPDGFSVSFDKNRLYAHIKDGAKAFTVSLDDLSGEYFDFTGYTNVNDENDYAAFPVSDKYSLVIRDKTTVIARTIDLVSPYKHVEDKDGKMFSVVSFATYSVPVLEEAYKTGYEVGKFTSLNLVGSLDFNGTVYSVVEKDGNYGFIPESFLIDNVITEDRGTERRNAYVWKRGGVYVYEEDKETVSDELLLKTKVSVVGTDGDYTLISYGNGKVGFVPSKFVMTDNRPDAMKFWAAVILSLSLLVTSLFIEFRYLYRKRV